MRLGIGLPNTVPGTPGTVLLEWARRAEAGPFDSLAALDRLHYDSYEPFLALAAAAAVTARVRLATMVVAGPLRSAARLAKESASLDALSGGRLVLGVALGARPDDYEAAEVSYATRGRRLTDQLARLHGLWADPTLGPRPVQPGGPPILVGGSVDAAFARMASFADGYAHAGGPPRAFAGAAAKAVAAWEAAGRPGRPQLWGQSYFAFGEAAQAGHAFLLHYYGFTGTFAERIAAGLLTTPEDVHAQIEGYREAGCDELVLLPATSDPDHLDRLAEIVAG